ncbi:Hypothetical predicted protein [Marmota monax]|uniref:Uncharacterized protein n=1 Tax=Marmota monax TaxID=9995 RepID=A0A5E4AUP6_MARMO|nr:Hypothetical predicted protein [Marmota monax]
MAGVGEGGRPSSAPPPQGTHVYVGVAVPQSHLSHPHSTKQKEKPPPPRAAPHPNLGCTFSGSQQSYGSGGHGWGRWPISLSWTVAVTQVCWSFQGPTVCAMCFSEG